MRKRNSGKYDTIQVKILLDWNCLQIWTCQITVYIYGACGVVLLLYKTWTDWYDWIL